MALLDFRTNCPQPCPTQHVLTSLVQGPTSGRIDFKLQNRSHGRLQSVLQTRGSTLYFERIWSSDGLHVEERACEVVAQLSRHARIHWFVACEWFSQVSHACDWSASILSEGKILFPQGGVHTLPGSSLVQKFRPNIKTGKPQAPILKPTPKPQIMIRRLIRS